MGGSTTQAEMVRTERLTPQQLDLLSGLIGQIQPQIGAGVEAYPGEITPAADPMQQQAFDLYAAMAGGEPSAMRMGALEDIVSGKPSFEMTPESMAQLEDFYETAFVVPSRAGFERELEDIAEFYTARGLQRGGNYLDALGRAAAEYHTGLAGKRAELLRGDIEAERQAREAAYGRILPGVEAYAAEEQRVPAALMMAGAARRDIESQRNVSDMYKWMYSQPYQNPWLGYLGLALGTQQWQFGTEQTGVEWHAL